jgi:16S rRNA U1498 N3-methylase RsmE
VREMSPVLSIGLPEISEEVIEKLTEDCEAQISGFIVKRIPEKSIESMFVSCTLEFENGQLDLDVQIELSQVFDTGHSLDDILQEATDFGVEWLEKQLTEMKTK